MWARRFSWLLDRVIISPAPGMFMGTARGDAYWGQVRLVMGKVQERCRGAEFLALE